MAAKSTVFKTNRSQAVRIPKEVAFPDDVREVEIIPMGQGLLIVPKGRSWAEWARTGPFVGDEFPDRIEDAPARDVSFDD